MRAARLIRQGEDLALEDIPVPTPSRDELLVKLQVCGVCHTDVHIREGDEEVAGEDMPITLGHEGVGVVTAVGADVTTFAEGDRVGAPWLHDTCQTCGDCLVGDESICIDARAHGLQANGAFAEYVIVKEAFAVPIPDSLDSVTAAPILCAGATAYTAVKRANLAPGQTCAIFGCGGLGQYAIQYARLTGATIVAIDRDPGQFENARKLGAHHCIESNAETGSKLRELGGADACINFAPTPAIWPAVEEGMNSRGRFVSVALPPDPVSMSLHWLVVMKPTVTGIAVGNRAEMNEALNLAETHNISVPITTVPLDQVNHTIDRLAGKPGTDPVRGRVVIDLSL